MVPVSDLLRLAGMYYFVKKIELFGIKIIQVNVVLDDFVYSFNYYCLKILNTFLNFEFCPEHYKSCASLV